MSAETEVEYAVGARVRVQMNGVPQTYDGTVEEPPTRYVGDRDYDGYVWVRRDVERDVVSMVVPWRPASLTLLLSGGG